MLPSDPKLYAILDLGYVSATDAEEVTRELLKGGADLLQLRAKGKELDLIRDVASRLIPLCREAQVPFILNDFPEMAAGLDADGVHIGQDDGEIAAVRKIVGPGKIVGRSTHSLNQARAALAEGADYIGFGPLFPTPTKPGRPAIGLENIPIMEAEVGSALPAFCIGGINRTTLPLVINSGARRIVVVSDLLQAENISEAARFFKDSLNHS
ncbi:thiamine phosphate synthase [Luteolibacter pohnpeiensis]|uniref:Thiamine-phosphate synthase n=1 Tax=Luteolibacter pohnpeiensis TaxID=454153 RepID=A0A934S7Y4_9BACT|nr:thiamine phosphate synthase [Luteolibacter pohnpeiensis]MBK1883498.1 thiamine phosphate synthase [Luteolibacter pohnpeiensis]